MKMPGVSLLEWQKNMGPKKPVQERFIKFAGQKGSTVPAVDVNNPDI